MISISANLNIMIKAAEKASKSVIRDFGEVEKLQVSKKGPAMSSYAKGIIVHLTTFINQNGRP